MIAVFGSIHIDIITRVAALPRPGETVIGAAYRLTPGGKGGNQALAARRAGAKVRLIGAVGRDAFAEPALDLLQAAGVDLSLVRRISTLPTGLAAIAVDAEGENQIVVAPGANSEVAASDIPETVLSDGILFLAQTELRAAEVAKTMLRAKQAGARIVLNYAPAVPIPESALDLADLLVANAGEAAILAKSFALAAPGPADLAGAIAERRGGPVVVTAGAQGAFLAMGRYTVEHVPAPAIRPLDTTGAGDALVGALAAALDAGASLPEAVRRGVAAGTIACTREGAQPAMPTTGEIDTLLATGD